MSESKNNTARKGPFNTMAVTRFGPMLYNIHDKYVGRSLAAYGEFSLGETTVFDSILSEGDFVIDAGANIGAHTLYYAHKGCTVLAFEPQRLVHQLLCANMALNSAASVYCFHAALGAAPGHLAIPELDPRAPDTNWGGLEIEGYTNGTVVPVNTIDEFELPACRLIKVDVEGMEEKVLRGAKDTIEKYHPVLYLENDRANKAEALVAYVESLGYVMRSHQPMLFNPDNFSQNPKNLFPNIASMNLICVHKDDTELMGKIEAGL